MKASEIMSAPAITVSESDRLKNVAKILIEEGFNGLPVVNDGGELMGIVTEGDIVRLQEIPGDGRLDSNTTQPTTVRQVMTRDVISVGPDAGVGWVAHLMRDRHLRTIPVTDLQRVVGVITRRDLLGVIARRDDEIAFEADAILDAQSRTLGTFKAEVREGVVTLIGPAQMASRAIAASLLYSIPGVVDVRTSVP
jgi:CBS-domain-containing membrane protein